MSTTSSPLHVGHEVLGHPQLARALAESRSSGRVVIDLSASTPAGLNFGDEPTLISAALAALAEAGHPLASLALLGLSEPLRLPEPATLAFLCSCGLSELQLSDVSAKRAEADGAANLLRPAPPTSSGSDSDCEGGGPVVSLADSIRTRGSAMLRFAAALPQLKRLTACSAAFPAAHVSALAALSGLEELSLSGAMECAPGPGPTPGRGGPCGRSLASAGRQGPAAVASATYQGLLAALPRLRRLALPMALASQEPSAAYGTRWGAPAAASSLYDSSDDEDCGPDPGLSSGYTSDAGASSLQWTWGGLTGGGGSGGIMSGLSGYSTDSGLAAQSTASLRGDAGSLLGAGGWGVLTALRLHHEAESCLASSSAATGLCVSPLPPPRVLLSRKASEDDFAAWASSAADLDTAAAAAQTPRSGTPPSAPASARSRPAWRFPPGLEEMTLPLCALNTPLFHALCCEYGSDRYEHGGVCGTEASYGDAAADGASLPYAGLKALHVTCAPGYSSWEGSFLKTEADFAALSRLTGLETLHLALELGAPGGPRRETLLRAAFARLRALPNIRELRISETRLPLCFTVCKPRTSAPPLALADVLGARTPGPLPALPPLPLAPALPPMPTLSRSASLPFALARGKLSSSLTQLAPGQIQKPPVQASGPPPSAALQPLLSSWPRLQRLTFFSQVVVRVPGPAGADGDRLVFPTSIRELAGGQ
ncbi:hypothetical protein HYH03_014255 [Edaphochlamys debaryana]|uniref:Uncharacterized protein n=1 Tax=Edaphochlamys debaryana TaxID=47281 RepID=A0A835XLQ6_9CHLO|nr:hypothetical protein HYH03_014255 [Edaphochlamys debaryana]|eukprot:KAG2487142.1 hypothetical protein HYH03_014255 [Edaphochlamys debaryana]